MAVNRRRRYTSFDEICEVGLQGRVSAKVQHNTYIQVRDRDEDDIIDSVAVLLHETDILTFTEDGVTFNTGGWRSKLTKDRFNEYAPVILYSEKGEWYCIPPGKDWRENDVNRWVYFDGMKVSYSGELLNPRTALEREVTSAGKRYMQRKIDAWLSWVEKELDEGVSLYAPFGNDTHLSPADYMTETAWLLSCVDNYTYFPDMFMKGMERRGIQNILGLELRCGLRPDGTAFGEPDRNERSELRKTLRAGIAQELLQESVYVPYYESR